MGRIPTVSAQHIATRVQQGVRHALDALSSAQTTGAATCVDACVVAVTRGWDMRRGIRLFGVALFIFGSGLLIMQLLSPNLMTNATYAAIKDAWMVCTLVFTLINIVVVKKDYDFDADDDEEEEEDEW